MLCKLADYLTCTHSPIIITCTMYLKEHVQGIFLISGQSKGKSLHIDHTPFILTHAQPTTRVYVCPGGCGSGQGGFAIIRQRGEEIEYDFIVDFKVRNPTVVQVEEQPCVIGTVLSYNIAEQTLCHHL